MLPATKTAPRDPLVLPAYQIVLKDALTYTFDVYHKLYQTPSFNTMNDEEIVDYNELVDNLLAELPPQGENGVPEKIRHLVRSPFSDEDKTRISALMGTDQPWETVSPLMQDDTQRIDLWVVMYPNAPEQAWQELTGEEATPTPERRKKILLKIMNRVHAKLLFAYQKRLEGLTWAQIMYCIHMQLEKMPAQANLHEVKEVCSDIFKKHHPYVVYTLMANHCAALVKLPLFSGDDSQLFKVQRKQLFKEIKLSFRPTECEGYSDWYKTKLLMNMDRLRHCKEDSTRFVKTALEFEEVWIDLRQKFLDVLKPAARNAIQVNRQISCNGLGKLIAKFQGENPDASSRFQAIVAANELEPKEAVRTSLQGMFASKVLRMMEKDQKKLVTEILSMQSIEDIKTLLDSRDMNIVYNALLNNRKEIVDGVELHMTTDVDALCNKTVHAIWRHWFPKEAKKMEDENRARLIEQFGDADAAEALSRFITDTLAESRRE